MPTLPSPLRAVIHAQHSGRSLGIASICSAHPTVLAAAMDHGVQTGAPVLIESTCNQVNQDGGYTGLTPAAFMSYVRTVAGESGLPDDQLIVGGDHLGPSPWQHLPAAEALDRARVLVRDCVLAGYTKIHLDASMCLGDDPPGALDMAVAAARSAELAAAAEAAFASSGLADAPLYVVGTEVPVPGGAHGAESAPAVTTPEDAAATLDATQAAFAQRGLGAAWERVVALVVQPGVEYGDDALYDYDRAAARRLSRFIETRPGLVYEAHSTDYQTPAALRALVEDHFAILKVGPALTFAYREAIYALAHIEREWLAGRTALSGVRQALDAAMLANPVHWDRYYQGSELERAFKRAFSLSDRSRYYWPDPSVQASVRRLVENLSAAPIPLPLLSQYLPRQAERVRDGALDPQPEHLLRDAVSHVLEQYADASGR